MTEYAEGVALVAAMVALAAAVAAWLAVLWIKRRFDRFMAGPPAQSKRRPF